MELTLLIIVIVVQIAIFIAMLVLRPRHAGDDVPERINELDRKLADQFTSVAGNTAKHLEAVKGDLRTDLADRIHGGLDELKKAVEQQLASGRSEQDKRLGETVTRLESKFDALSERQGRGLTDSRSELTASLTTMTQALDQKFSGLEGKTQTHLDAIRDKVDARLGDIAKQVQDKLDQNIKEGFAHFELVRKNLKDAEEQLRNVGEIGKSISDLNSLLKLPHLRGKFGEAALERLLADFLPANLYELQATREIGRPDALILLPNAKLPIDSKFLSMPALFESSDPQQLTQARAELARVIKEQARSIAKYIQPQAGTTEVALMFLPSETLWFEVIRDRELSDELSRLRVYPTSPNTLMLVLSAISQAYKWYELRSGYEKSVKALERARKSFKDFLGKFEDVGKHLQKAQDVYSTASTHLGRYQTRVTGLTGEVLDEGEGENGPDETVRQLPLKASEPPPA